MRHRWLQRRFSAAALLLCAGLLVAAGPRRTYEKELRTWTDELKVYRNFDTALILRATYLDAPMRRLLADERRRLMNPTPEDHAAFEQRMADDQGRFHDIVFSAQTPIAAATTFGEADTGWVLWLEADGNRQKLISIERIRKPTSLHRELYAHMNVWSELWIARFEKTVQDPDDVVLHVGSGFGNGDVSWTGLDDKR